MEQKTYCKKGYMKKNIGFYYNYKNHGVTATPRDWIQ